jgi:hypothetical protein
MAIQFGHTAFVHQAIGLSDLEDHTLRRRLPLPYPFSATWAVRMLGLVTTDDYMCLYSFGKDIAFDGTEYHTAAIIPSSAHGGAPPAKWSVGANGFDDPQGYISTDRWYYQGVRCYRTDTDTIHEFYYDLPDTSLVSTISTGNTTYFNTVGTSHMIRIGDVPWAENENLDGAMCGVKIWNANLAPFELAYEARSPWPLLPRHYLSLWECLPLTTVEDRQGSRHSVRTKNGRRFEIIDTANPPTNYPVTPDRWRHVRRPVWYQNLDVGNVVSGVTGGNLRLRRLAQRPSGQKGIWVN